MNKNTSEQTIWGKIQTRINSVNIIFYFKMITVQQDWLETGPIPMAAQAWPSGEGTELVLTPQLSLLLPQTIAK